jgi:hypothetical protein
MRARDLATGRIADQDRAGNGNGSPKRSNRLPPPAALNSRPNVGGTILRPIQTTRGRDMRDKHIRLFTGFSAVK